MALIACMYAPSIMVYGVDMESEFQAKLNFSALSIFFRTCRISRTFFPFVLGLRHACELLM